MTVLELPTLPPAVQVSESTAMMPRPHRWTADEYFVLSDSGALGGRRTELIDGEILDMVSQYNPHAATISKTNRLLVAAFDESYWLLVQSTIRLPSGDVPDPDFTVRPGPVSGDNSVHPLPLLVIEVSDTTLLFDQIVKSSMYAANGIQDYWIINVKDRRVEVLRNPIKDENRKFGWRYSELNVIAADGFVSPLSKPDVRLEVAKMLP
jgi:Uma2 family endonuclease